MSRGTEKPFACSWTCQGPPAVKLPRSRFTTESNPKGGQGKAAAPAQRRAEATRPSKRLRGGIVHGARRCLSLAHDALGNGMRLVLRSGRLKAASAAGALCHRSASTPRLMARRVGLAAGATVQHHKWHHTTTLSGSHPWAWLQLPLWRLAGSGGRPLAPARTHKRPLGSHEPRLARTGLRRWWCTPHLRPQASVTLTKERLCCWAGPG